MRASLANRVDGATGDAGIGLARTSDLDLGLNDVSHAHDAHVIAWAHDLDIRPRDIRVFQHQAEQFLPVDFEPGVAPAGLVAKLDIVYGKRAYFKRHVVTCSERECDGSNSVGSETSVVSERRAVSTIRTRSS